MRTQVSVPIPSQPAKKWPLIEGESGHIFLIVGRGEKIRTSDPHNPIVVRYQAALRPDRIWNALGLLTTQYLKDLFKFQS